MVLSKNMNRTFVELAKSCIQRSYHCIYEAKDCLT